MPKKMYDAVSLTEMKEFYTVKNFNLKELAVQYGGSTTSVRKALADAGATIRTRGRIKGKAVGPRKPKAAPVLTMSDLQNQSVDSEFKTRNSPVEVPSVDRADELEKFLSVLRKD